ncbi:multimerin-2-like isoform X1 [Anguilla rostrata]|uniref:multimerin-2-like isoform X1 n=1 Tax=Anguilla rostrata TaxID=7938 RepID=UPI0030D23AD7
MARVLLLLLGFLLEALCDIRARDPEVEEDGVQGHAGWRPQGVGTHGNRPPVPGYGPLPGGPVYPHVGSREESAPPSGKFQSNGARTGNWCSFVHQHKVTKAVVLRQESYIVKSLSPCPSGPPDCQVVMYKVSLRPVYKEGQKIVTSLLWHCCPGFGGHNCEATAADARASEPGDRTAGDPREGLGDAQLQASARETQLSEDLSWEQRDFQPPGDPLGNSPHPAVSPRDVKQTGEHRGAVASVPLPAPPTSGTPPLHHTTAALMAQLSPVLDGFNRTLRRLSQEVGRLSQGLAELRRDQQGGAPRRGGGGGGGGPRGHNLEARLIASTNQIGQVRALLSARQNELEGRLQSQHAALHHHLTAFKADTDSKIGQNQASLRSLNATLEEVILNQRRLEDAALGWGVGGGGEPGLGAAAWQAIGRLQATVSSNGAKVAALEGKSETAVRHLGDLQRGLRGLEGKLALTGRGTQAHFSDTALDVEDARAAMLGRVAELADNLTAHGEHLSELDSDMRYLRERLDGAAAPPGCDCPALAKAVSELQRDVAGAARAAEEDRRAREEGAGGPAGPGVGSLSDLRQGLRQVRDSLASEQDRGRATALNVTRLQAAQEQVQRDVLALLRRDGEKTKEMRRLAGSFSSLLKDAIRHSEVLEVLLEEEVLEFKRLPPEEQREYSIPLLRRRILLAQEQVESHAVTLAALESPVANDDPSGALAERLKREADAAYGSEDYSVSDFWSLGREVEELETRLGQLEGRSCLDRCCNCTSRTTTVAPTGPAVELQDEVVTLRKELEDHLHVFRNLFGNTGGLERSNGTLDLEVLWAAVREKEGKKKFKKQRKDKERSDRHRAEMVNSRSKREPVPKAADLSQFPDASIAFLARSRDGAGRPGPLTFETVSLNRGRAYSAGTGVFRAPRAGLYLFLLTLDFGPGPGAAVLKRDGAPAATVRRGRGEAGGAVTRVCALELGRGERVHLELERGTVGPGNPTDNAFAGLLVLGTT